MARDTYAGSRFNYVPGFEQGNAPLITSEYGGVGALDGDRDISLELQVPDQRTAPPAEALAPTFSRSSTTWNGSTTASSTTTARRRNSAMIRRSINAGDVLPVDAAPVRRAAPGERVRVEVSSSHYGARTSARRSSCNGG